MSSESPESSIVRRLAESVCQRVARQTILSLQKMNSSDVLLSGEDSGLANVWDEICVQVQFEESLSWNAYEETMTALVEGLVDELPRHELDAIWLSTPEGEDWDCEPEEDRQPFTPCIEDVAQHILHRYVLSRANDWTNRRIRTFLERRVAIEPASGHRGHTL